MGSLDPLNDYIQAALGHFAQVDAAREQAIRLSRELIRTCASAIQRVHRGDLEASRKGLDEARAISKELVEVTSPYTELSDSGLVTDALKEYAEGETFLACVTGLELPSPEELGVAYATYLNGLAEAIGELRRHVLELLRASDVEGASEALAAMETIYSSLMNVHYPDAILQGLRHRADAARGMLERTRGEVTSAVQQARLEAELRKARELLEGGA